MNAYYINELMRQREIINNVVSHPVAKPRLPPWRTEPPKLKIKKCNNDIHMLENYVKKTHFDLIMLNLVIRIDNSIYFNYTLF